MQQQCSHRQALQPASCPAGQVGNSMGRSEHTLQLAPSQYTQRLAKGVAKSARSICPPTCFIGVNVVKNAVPPRCPFIMYTRQAFSGLTNQQTLSIQHSCTATCPFGIWLGVKFDASHDKRLRFCTHAFGCAAKGSVVPESVQTLPSIVSGVAHKSRDVHHLCRSERLANILQNARMSQ